MSMERQSDGETVKSNRERVDEIDARGRDYRNPPPTPPRNVGGGISVGGGTGKSVLISVVVTAVIILIMTLMGGVGFVTKSDFDKNMGDMTTTLAALRKDITNSLSEMTATVKAVPTSVTNQVNAATSQYGSQINNINQGLVDVKRDLGTYAKTDSLTQINSTMTSLKSTVDSLVNTVNTFKASHSSEMVALNISVTDIKAQLVALDTRLKALEIPSGGGGGGSGKVVIPSVVITAGVTDEGTLQTTDNSTIGEVKLSLANNGTRDIVDVVLDVYVYFDSNSGTTQVVTSVSYGSWSIRERSSDEIQLRGRLTRLYAGQTRRIYIDIQSWGIPIGINGARNTTYLSVSANDVEVSDWNYAD